jgi:CubicO group peptidase (beta-lactamase class C family)
MTYCELTSSFNRRGFILGLSSVLALSGASTVALGQQTEDAYTRRLDDLFKKAIEEHKAPGVVFVLGHKNRVLYQKTYGAKALVPQYEPMNEDTIFDMASLTKPLITALAMMQFWERGFFSLDDQVRKFLPEFDNNGKAEITIRHIMTHFSGLPEDVDLTIPWSGKQAGTIQAMQVAPLQSAGKKFSYSDINFLVAGLLVEKFSGKSLNEYANENIIKPIGLSETDFMPLLSLTPRIAPTEYDNVLDPVLGRHIMLRGIVDDPTARRMGGVAGHAGLFSTAHDITIYAQALLNCYAGRESNFPLRQKTLLMMSSPQQPAGSNDLQGLGWDINTAYSRPRGGKFPIGSFGHTGYTGTSIWIDPKSDTFVLILTSRLHPDSTGDVRQLRYDVATESASYVGL